MGGFQCLPTEGTNGLTKEGKDGGTNAYLPKGPRDFPKEGGMGVPMLTPWRDWGAFPKKDGDPNVYPLKGLRGLSKEGKDGGPNTYLPKGQRGLFTENTPFEGAVQHHEWGKEDDFMNKKQKL